MRKAVLLAVFWLFVGMPTFAGVTSNEQIPITREVFIPCANGGVGELVSLSGYVHVQYRLTVNDNTMHLGFKANPQGVVGQGQTTGDKYQGTGDTEYDINVSPVPTFPYNNTFTGNYRIIGHGPGNNFLHHETYHITINANGEVTTELDKSIDECK